MVERCPPAAAAQEGAGGLHAGTPSRPPSKPSMPPGGVGACWDGVACFSSAPRSRSSSQCFICDTLRFRCFITSGTCLTTEGAMRDRPCSGCSASVSWTPVRTFGFHAKLSSTSPRKYVDLKVPTRQPSTLYTCSHTCVCVCACVCVTHGGRAHVHDKRGREAPWFGQLE